MRPTTPPRTRARRRRRRPSTPIRRPHPPTSPPPRSRAARSTSAGRPSTDNVGVDRYLLTRDSEPPVSIAGNLTSYSDTGLGAGTTHAYTVRAVDAAGNESADSSPPAQATTTSVPQSPATFNPVADARVDASAPTTNAGTQNKLRVDSSPEVNSYLRFNPQNVTGTITQAKLRVWATSANPAGYSVNDVSDDSWGETTINFSNAPPIGASVGNSGPVVANAWNEIDVTSLISGNGLASLALKGVHPTAIAFDSREGPHQPELVVSFGSAPPDTTPPTVPQNVNATAASASRIDVSWSASSDDVGVDHYLLTRDGQPPITVAGNSDQLLRHRPRPGQHSHLHGQGGRRRRQRLGGLEPAGAGDDDGRQLEATFNPVADAKVDASTPGQNTGTQNKLRVDSSPEVNSYLRFNVQNMSRNDHRGQATGLGDLGEPGRLLWSRTSPTTAGERRRSPSPTLRRSGRASATPGRPSPGPGTRSTSPRLISGNGLASLALTGVHSTAIAFDSREATHPPELVVTSGSPPPADTTPPTSPPERHRHGGLSQPDRRQLVGLDRRRRRRSLPAHPRQPASGLGPRQPDELLRHRPRRRHHPLLHRQGGRPRR